MRKLLFFLLISFSLQALQLKDENQELKPAAKELLALFEIPDTFSQDELVSFLKSEWMQKGKERWEMVEKFSNKWETTLPLLKELSCIEAIAPEKKHYDYALVLGALGPSMKRRLDYLLELWELGVRFNSIVLLTGARDLNRNRENYPEGLKTEADLLVHLFHNHPLSYFSPYVLVDGKKTALARRPTTASTILKWLETNPQPGSCLAISTQPFVGYQEAVVRSCLPPTFKVEAVGPAIISPTYYPLSVYLDNFAKWLSYEHLLELQREEFSSKSLSDSSRGNRMDPSQKTHWENRHSPNR